MALDFSPGVATLVNHGSAASLDDMDVGTYVVWMFPTSTDARSICDKRDTSGWRTFPCQSNSRLAFQLNRATVNLTIFSSNDFYTANVWNFAAATWDASGADADQKLFQGTLSAAVAEESSYGTQTVGSGATVTNAGGDFFVGNNGENNVALIGRIAWFGVWNVQLTLAQLQAQQFFPHKTAGCVLFSHYGYNGVGTQADWSGNVNNGTVTGATQADHVPLGPLVRSDTFPTVAAGAAPAGNAMPMAIHHYGMAGGL